MRSRTDLPHIPALDGIRGVAVLGILLFHAGHLVGGWLGVDLFLVLSGFLITSLLLAEYEATETISIPGFWIRRARRLIPGLYAGGMDAGGMWGDSYCMNPSSGLSGGFALNSGIIAGKNILKYVKG